MTKIVVRDVPKEIMVQMMETEMTSERCLDDTQLNTIERQALGELRQRLFQKYDFVEQLVLFGSVARGTASEESDIDLLILTSHPLDNWVRREISEVVSDVNLEYETNICTIVLDQWTWTAIYPTELAIKQEVQRDGIVV